MSAHADTGRLSISIREAADFADTNSKAITITSAEDAAELVAEILEAFPDIEIKMETIQIPRVVVK